MNSEQLEKINVLVNELGKVQYILDSDSLWWTIKECKLDRNRYSLEVDIDREIIEPALETYRDELKAKLKELGYEEQEVNNCIGGRRKYEN